MGRTQSLVCCCLPGGHRAVARELSMGNLHFINFYFKGETGLEEV